MKHLSILALCAIISLPATAASLTVDGSPVVEIQPDASTGLKSVYVIENAAMASITYTSNGGEVTWQRFSNLGGGYAEDVPFEQSGKQCSITPNQGDMGYIITEGSTQTCFWVVDYAAHTYRISNVTFGESDCNRAILIADGSADAIAYYTVNGRRTVLSRDIQVEYYSMTYNEDNAEFEQSRTTASVADIEGQFSVPAPLCDTQFTISPDRFEREWGYGNTITTSTFQAIAIDVRTSAQQTEREVDNEKPLEAELGGSAPCEITFKAAVTDAAIFHRWEISTDSQFESVDLQYNDTEFTYTFTEAGTTYVRLVANNADATCEYISDPYTISVGDSQLECPNAFSPGASEGVNDIWKVSFRSIIEFDCHIFNRWGKEIIHLTDPSQGWDGRYNGKLVPTGTYFYVIKARGSDNRDYNLSGHINIVNSRVESSSSPSEPAE